MSRTEVAVASNMERPGKKRARSDELMFVNFTNPAQESKDKGIQTLIKRKVMENWLIENGAHRGQPRSRTNSKQSSTSDVKHVETIRVISQLPDFRLASAMDPFDSLPMKPDNHAQELLQSYLTAAFLPRDNEHYRVRVRDFRQRFAAPLLLSTKGSLATLITYAELTAGMGPTDQTFLLSHLGTAVSSLKDEISDCQNPVADGSLEVAVGLLMTVTQYTGDQNAMKQHFRGLALLLSQRWHVFDSNIYLRGSLICWALYEDAFDDNSSRYSLPTFMRPSVLGTEAPKAKVPLDASTGSGFAVLYRQGLIPESLASMTRPILHLAAMLEYARSDDPMDELTVQSTIEILQYIWLNGWSLFKLRQDCSDSLLANCCRLTMLIYHFIILCPRYPPMRPSSMVCGITMLIYRQLVATDVYTLLSSCPDALLWITLTAGAIAMYPKMKPEMRYWFTILLVEIRLRLRLRLSVSTFEDAVDTYAKRFFWTRSMEFGAQALWELSSAHLQDDTAFPQLVQGNLRGANVPDDSSILGLARQRDHAHLMVGLLVHLRPMEAADVRLMQI